jgi:hypothetical protein
MDVRSSMSHAEVVDTDTPLNRWCSLRGYQLSGAGIANRNPF